MAATKKAAAADVVFEGVPSLGDVDPEFAATDQQLRDVMRELAEAEAERSKLASDLKQKPGRRPMAPGVAARLGETIETDDRATRLQVLRRTIAECQEAEKILRERLSHQRAMASAKVCEHVAKEYGRRVATLVCALVAARAAYGDLDGLIAELEANDVSWAPLGIFRVPGFLDRIGAVEREAKEHGYV